MPRIYVFSTDACAFCEHAKALLSKRGVPFEDVNLSAHPKLQADLAELTGLTGFPQILVESETLGGLNELRSADRDGTLAGWAAEARSAAPDQARPK
jgi:glutaredoxin 3